MPAFVPHATMSLSPILAAEKAITGIAQAAPPVATSTAHGLNDGDVIAVKVATLKPKTLNQYFAVRVTSDTADTIDFDNQDWSNAAAYAPILGATAHTGTFRKAGSQVIIPIDEIEKVETKGGDAKTFTAQSQGNMVESTGISGINARTMTLTIKAQSSAAKPDWLKLLEDAAINNSELILRSQYINGGMETFDVVTVAPFKPSMFTTDTSKFATFSVVFMAQSHSATECEIL